MKIPDIINDMEPLAELVRQADRVHVKTFACGKSLRECLAAMLSYMPGWMRMLYRVRGVFVRLLGNRQEEVPRQHDLGPRDVSFTPGDPAAFFTVAAGEEERFWAAEARDRMISGFLAVAMEPGEQGINRFHLLTMAKYHHFTGRIYFNIINPFHHFVVFCMARRAVRA